MPLWFLASSNKLLEKVTVISRGETLRSYAFDYKGSCIPGKCSQVSDSMTTRKEVAFRTSTIMMMCRLKGICSVQDDSEKWNTHDDGLGAGFVNPLKTVSKRFSDKPTALGGTTSSSVSGSFYAGVGVGRKQMEKQYNRRFIQLFKRYQQGTFRIR